MLRSLPRLSLLAALSGTLVLAGPVLAQGDATQGRFGRAELTESTAGTYYRYFVPGEATIQVSVVGAVQQPGLYEIGVGTDLGRLLALAGGPRVDARERRQQRRVELRLFRPNAGTQAIYATTLQDAATNPDAYPVLQEGDTLMIDVVRSSAFGWQEVVSIVGGLSAAAFVVQVLTGR